MYKKSDSNFNKHVTVLLPGEYHVTDKYEILSTVLGSCISVCLHDGVNGVSGMNHFMLPHKNIDNFTNDNYQFNEKYLIDDSLRYGVTSMEIMINHIIKLGGDKKYLTAKIFGGAKVLHNNSEKFSVGETNINFILAFLKTEGIRVTSQDVGLNVARKIYYLTKNNTVYLKKIPITKIQDDDIKPKNISHGGEITLFS